MTTQGKGLSLEELQAVMDANSGTLPEVMPVLKVKPTRKLSVTEQRQALLDTADAGISNAKEALQELLDDLEEKSSNMEEHFSGTERYSRFEEACGTLEEAISNLDSVDVAGMELP